MGKMELAIGVTFLIAAPALAVEPEIDEDAIAGKKIFDSKERYGCARCHAPDGSGEAEGKRYAGNNIQGKTAQDIRLAIMALPMMWNVKLSDAELEQVAAYLEHLQVVAE